MRFLTAITRRLPSWLPRPSPRSQVAMGLASIVTSVLMLLSVGDMVPDPRHAILDGRASVSEALALSVNALLSVPGEKGSNGVGAIEPLLKNVVDREETLLSAAVSDPDGNAVLEVGPHSGHWAPLDRGVSTDAQVQVPLLRGPDQIGSLQLRFEPVVPDDLFVEFIESPLTWLIGCMGFTCFLLFYLFLGKVLQHLDPTQAVPSRVRSALDTLAEGLIVLDRQERIVLANAAFAELCGREPDTLVGTSPEVLEWRAPESGDDDSEASPLAAGHEFPWTLAIREDRPQQNVMLRFATDDEVKSFVVNCSPVKGAEGESQGVLASFEDVTQLEKKKVELRRSMEAAEQANEAKSSFLANMSHEIRTPMNAILGFTDVLRRGLITSDGDRTRHLNTIHSSGTHLLELINDILDLSKIEAGRLEIETTECSIHDTLSEVVNVLRVKAEEKGLGLTYETDGPIPEEVRSDPTRIRQIVTNLIGNALKFTHEGGVTVRARAVTPAGNGTDGLSLEIAVIDTGIGMSPEQCSKIFEAFTQADSSTTRNYGGTGLGLSISKQFAQALGGDIVVTSEEGLGSVFTAKIFVGPVDPAVTWSTANEYAARSRPNSAPSDTKNWRLPSRNVLVVDDGDANRQLIKLVLGKAGLTVDEAANGLEAVEQVPRGVYDIVLMDMQMPVLDGYSATRRLREEGCELPIIALTGNAMKGDEQKCIEAGCSGFLSKPVDIDQLLRTVADELGVVAEAVPDRLTETPAPPGPAPAVTPASSSAKHDGVSQPRSGALEDVLADVDAALNQEAPQTAQAESGPELLEASAAPEQNGENPFADDPFFAGSEVAPVGQSVALPEDAIVSALPADDHEFMCIVAGFVDRLHEQVDSMKVALDAGEFNELSELAHWLKGAGGTMGFSDFTEPAQRLEDRARAFDAAGCDEAVQTLVSLTQRVVRPQTRSESALSGA